MDEDEITYNTYGIRAVLDMRSEDLNMLMLMLGYACGAAHEKKDQELIDGFNAFITRLREATTAKS